MTNRKKLDALSRLVAADFRAKQAEFASILAHEAQLRENLAQLMASRQSRAAELPSPCDAALNAGADMRWLQWVDQRRAAINAELARVMVRKENFKIQLQRAFGRDQAADALIRAATAEHRQKFVRNSAYES